MKIEPVSHWRLLPKTWSIRLGSIATAIMAFISLFPVNAYDMWASLPYEAKQYIPVNYVSIIGIVLYVLAMVSQFIRQRKLVQQMKAHEND